MVLGQRNVYSAKKLRLPGLVDEARKHSVEHTASKGDGFSRIPTRQSNSLRGNRRLTSALADQLKIKQSFSPAGEQEKSKESSSVGGKAEQLTQKYRPEAPERKKSERFPESTAALVARGGRLRPSDSDDDSVFARERVGKPRSRSERSESVDDPANFLPQESEKSVSPREDTDQPTTSWSRLRSQSWGQSRKGEWKGKPEPLVKHRSQPFISVWQKFEKGVPPTWLGRSETERLESQVLDRCEDILDEIRRTLEQTEVDFDKMHQRVAVIRAKIPEMRCFKDVNEYAANPC